jgi:hypothetical protein
MTITVANIDIGYLPNDGTGDPLRTAFEKINLNFAELSDLGPDGPNGSFQFNANGVPSGTANFAYVAANNIISLGSNIIPSGNVVIGTTANPLLGLSLANAGLRIGNVSVVESGNTLSFPVTVNPVVQANLTANNITVTGNLTAGQAVYAGNTYLKTFTATTSNNIANQTIFQIPATEFKNGTFYIDSRQEGSNNSQTVSLTITKSPNNSSVNFCVSGTIFVGNVVTDYNASVVFGNVRVQVSPFPNATIEHTVAYQVTN